MLNDFEIFSRPGFGGPTDTTESDEEAPFSRPSLAPVPTYDFLDISALAGSRPSTKRTYCFSPAPLSSSSMLRSQRGFSFHTREQDQLNSLSDAGNTARIDSPSVRARGIRILETSVQSHADMTYPSGSQTDRAPEREKVGIRTTSRERPRTVRFLDDPAVRLVKVKPASRAKDVRLKTAGTSRVGVVGVVVMCLRILHTLHVDLLRAHTRPHTDTQACMHAHTHTHTHTHSLETTRD